MNEEEWLACAEPEPMLRFLRPRCSDRKQRLFCCACCRRLPALISDAIYERAPELGEGIADAQVDQNTQEMAEAEARTVWMEYGDGFESWMFYAASLAYITIGSHHLLGSLSAISARQSANESDAEETPDGEAGIALEQLAQAQPGLVRDIFGNPFRPVAFDPAWRTDTAVSLARKMYEAREFGAMPILADALQDAGCNSDDILNHCREPGTHVRGCWVVDLVLGKE